MSALKVIPENFGYDPVMRSGRPSTQERSPFGQRLCEARISSGISQTQLAEKIGVSQSGYAAWERGRSSPSPAQIETLAQLLGVPVANFFEGRTLRQGGPKGLAKKLFEEVAELPRHHQKRILGTVEDMLIAQRAKGS
jgi:transcriptional regulator with XRE-family HTH domain